VPIADQALLEAPNVILYRARVFHTPVNPFEFEHAMEHFEDGAIAVDGDKIASCGHFSDLQRFHPTALVVDCRPGIILPGFVDCHVHFPQVNVIGAMGLQLLEWLDQRTLPEETLLENADHARTLAKEFLRLLAKNGTTSALVFGAHFKNAMHTFFEEARTSGLRITSGMVFSDRMLRPELHQDPRVAFLSGSELIERWHNRGRLRYAVMPRFALSCTDEMLEMCGDLLALKSDLLFHSHINENRAEIDLVKKLSLSKDYLEAYERFGLVGARSVFAHSVHPSDSELKRMAKAGSSVAHCASSNAFIGSGLMPLRRHITYGVRVALGSDVGGGTGFSLFKEGLEAYQMQMLRDAGTGDGVALTPARLLYLATRAGAEALHLHDVGDFITGRQADFMILKAPAGSTLEAALARSPNSDALLGTVFTLAREESVSRVYVAGRAVV
jgi:guanine deaminase